MSDNIKYFKLVLEPQVVSASSSSSQKTTEIPSLADIKSTSPQAEQLINIIKSGQISSEKLDEIKKELLATRNKENLKSTSAPIYSSFHTNQPIKSKSAMPTLGSVTPGSAVATPAIPTLGSVTPGSAAAIPVLGSVTSTSASKSGFPPTLSTPTLESAVDATQKPASTNPLLAAIKKGTNLKPPPANTTGEKKSLQDQLKEGIAKGAAEKATRAAAAAAAAEKPETETERIEREKREKEERIERERREKEERIERIEKQIKDLQAQILIENDEKQKRNLNNQLLQKKGELNGLIIRTGIQARREHLETEDESESGSGWSVGGGDPFKRKYYKYKQKYMQQKMNDLKK